MSDSVLLLPYNFKSNNKNGIAGFDLDHTIIKTKSKKTFPVDKDDWCIDDQVVNKLIDLNKKYNIVIFTNQGGIKSGKQDKNQWIEKCNNIVLKLNIPIIIIASIADDLNRKPNIGMWTYIIDTFNLKADIDHSFYCGDGAGRPKYLKRKADFSCSDYKFALNLNIKFYTPEELFYNSKLDIDIDPSFRNLTFDPRNYFYTSKSTEAVNSLNKSLDRINKYNRRMIILTGPMASGKSTFCNKYFNNPHTKIISQDVLKTVAKCKKECISFIQNNTDDCTVVIDNTNRDVVIRHPWCTIAKQNNLRPIVLWFDLPKECILHLNAFRSLTSDKKIPNIAIHYYFKNFEQPTGGETEDRCIIPFILHDDYNPLLTMFLH